MSLTPTQWVLLAVAALVLAMLVCGNQRKILVRFGGLAWDEREFCRHFLITGDTGSGKTTAGINVILDQLMHNSPDWGGMIFGVKGDEHQFVSKIAEENGRSADLIHLRVRPDEESTSWHPPHRFNLTGDRNIPWTTHAKMIVDIGASLTEGKQSAFFRPMAQLAIANAFALLDELGLPVTITRAYRLLTIPSAAAEAVAELEQLPPSDARSGLAEFFRNTFTEAQAYEQREAIEGTVKTFLGFFLDDDIAAVFSSDQPDTFSLSDLDHGRIITLTIPQRLATERRYVQTYLKLLLYMHALRRFDLPADEQRDRNLLVLVADEFQDIATSSEDGLGDHKMVDRVRAARLAVVAAVQSELSLDPVIGQARRKVLTLNMRSRLVFRAAERAGAESSADFIGKKMVWKHTETSRALDPGSRTRRREEEFRLRPAKLLRLKDFQSRCCSSFETFSGGTAETATLASIQATSSPYRSMGAPNR